MSRLPYQLLLFCRPWSQSFLVRNLYPIGNIANLTLRWNQNTCLREVLDITNCGIRGYLGEFRPALGSEFTLATVKKNVENGALTLFLCIFEP